MRKGFIGYMTFREIINNTLWEQRLVNLASLMHESMRMAWWL
jgi:hypothetical protein